MRRTTITTQRWFLVMIGTIIFAIALWQRLPAITFGLPYIPYPDESFVIDLVFRGFREHNLLFTNFLRPHLSYNLYAIAVALDAWWHGYAVQSLPVDTDRISAVITPFIAARSVSALIGAGCSLALYGWVLQVLSFPYAVIAGVTLAFVTYHIEFSGLLAPDIMACLGVTVFFMGASLYEKNPTRKLAMCIALCAGITAGTKYNFIALVFPLAWMLWHHPYAPLDWRVVGRITLCTITGFVLTTPSIVINGLGFFEGFIRILSYYQNENAVAGNYTTRFPFGLYGDWFSRLLISRYIAITAAIGCIILIRRLPRHIEAALLFTAIQFCFFFAQGVHYPRNFLFYQPIVIIIALYSINQFITHIPRLRPSQQQLLGLCVCLGLITPTIIAGSNSRTYYTRTYTPLQINALVAQSPKNAPTIGNIEPTILADKPWVTPANLIMNQDTAYWQSSGVQTLIVNRKIWPNTIIKNTTAHTRINGDNDGGSGWAYDIYTNDIKTTLHTVGAHVQGGDGVDIWGVRLGRGALRAQFSPLQPTQYLTATGDALLVNAYFRVQTPPTQTSALLFVHLFDAYGTKISERNTPPLDYYPMNQWQADEFIVARADVPTPPLAPGNYRLVLGFYIVEADQRIDLTGSNNGTYTIPITIVAP
jgi:hypothetical protein